MRLLVVEDDQALNELLVKQLKKEGYAVDSCMCGVDARSYLESTGYDGVLMDIMIPKPDGLTLLREMRARGNHVPVLLLTARDAVEDRVIGLDSGADDYLIKPFEFQELLARIRVMTRKYTEKKSNVLRLGDLSMNVSSHEVMRGSRQIVLTSKEFSVLEYLLRHAGMVLSRETLEHHIWDYEYSGASNVIDVYISCLRRKIDAGEEKKLIHTIRNVGYVIREEA